jgi:hypothetical protein
MGPVSSYLDQMRALSRCSPPPPSATIAATVLVGALLVGVRAADADIGIESVSRTSGVPGDQVELLVYCGGCLPQRVRLPISLLPFGDSPARHPCRGTSCAPRAPAPPTSDPYVPLGTAVPLDGGARLARRLGLEIPDAVMRHGRGALRDWVASTNRLRFRIPAVEPGLYTYVIFCCGIAPDAGDLIGHPQRRADRNQSRLAQALRDGHFLRIRAGAGRADESGERAWPLWTAIAALGLVALIAVWRRAATPAG